MTIDSHSAKAHRIKAEFAAKSVAEQINAAMLPAVPSAIPSIVARMEEMPKTRRMTYLEAMKGKSKTAAIKAFCEMCVGWDRNEVRECTSPACPLYEYRPYK